MLSTAKNPKTKKYRTGLYYRLSKDDGDKVESDSISNQRMMIRDYIRGREEFCVVDEYIDDGYSGASFDRPAFQRLYEDLQSGAVNCIIVKDLSRFGRNYIDVGRYLEHIFPEMGVRLIAINDNYDGESERRNSDAITVPIKNLMNDVYCREMSVKIKTLLEAKRKRGDCVSNYAPYGYKKNPRNRAKLVIDEGAAENVRNIYTWKLEGMSDQGIADRLNRLGIPSPLEYRIKSGQGISENFKKREQAIWSSKAVFRILHNEIYTGTLVQGKRKKLDYRSKEIAQMPEDSWVRVENMHEAVIDREQFELVQRLVEKDTRIAPGGDKVSLFSGYVVCGDCGAKMVMRTSNTGKKKYRYLICNQYKKDRSCTTHNISYEKLYEIVLKAVQHQVELAVHISQLMETMDAATLNQKQLSQLDARMMSLTEEVARYEKIRKNLYDDYAEGILSREDYMEYVELYSRKINDRQDAMKEVSKERSLLQHEGMDSEWISAFKKFHNITELTRPVLVELVKEIKVFDNGSIQIVFQYQDSILEMLENLSESLPGETDEKEKRKEGSAEDGSQSRSA
ncbi:MAG: recombinase family protein [Lachnospiraceae bacterium]|nr:recombinase family protein [Lachnospiraceae bacterium]